MIISITRTFSLGFNSKLKMSLADELLADLDELDEETPFETSEIEIKDDPDKMDTDNVDFSTDHNNIHRLLHSQKLADIKEAIDVFSNEPAESIGPVENHPEYNLIVDSNNMAVEIDNEIFFLHKYIRDLYNERFPELESLVLNPMDFVRTVNYLSNDLHKSKFDTESLDFLPSATVMVVSVTAATTQGKPLEEDQISKLSEACKAAFELEEIRQAVLMYVESRMAMIAPNLSRIIGTTVATKLMGQAGGLTALSKMPSCNVQVLGQTKKTLSGFSSSQAMPHTGILFYSDLVQALPKEYRRKAAKLLAAKCTLAARVDASHQATDGSVGQQFLDDINQKIEKMQEAPPLIRNRALPRPDDEPRKKRGGRRVRKMKEKTAVTELRRRANRMNFAQLGDDALQDDLGFSLGNIGKDGSGKVRGAVIDKKTALTLSKKVQRKIQKDQAIYGGKSTVRGQVSGTASSIAFTPLQGLEIVNPGAAEGKAACSKSQNYFSSGFGFTKKSLAKG